MIPGNPTSDLVTSTTMFRLHSWKPKIESFQVIKQSACFVTFIGDWYGKPSEQRERKEGQWFESWEAAHAALVNKYRGEVERAKAVLQQKRTALGQVESMSKPV